MIDIDADLRTLMRVRGLVRSGTAMAVREAAGIGVTEMAKAAQVSPRSIYRWERRLALPHGDAALRYGRVLNDLLGGQ